MGFHAEVVVLHANHCEVTKGGPFFREEHLNEGLKEDPLVKKAFTIWRAEERITLGDVTRLEKIISPNFRHLEWSYRNRASICVVSYILKKFLKILPMAKKADFAPIFGEPGVWSPYIGQFGRWNEKPMYPQIREIKDGDQYVDCRNAGEYIFSQLETISGERLKNHNRLVALPEIEFEKYIHHEYFFLEAPIPWLSCKKLASWLFYMERYKSREWEEILKNKNSLALVRAWRSYLTELGKMETMALIIFS